MDVYGRIHIYIYAYVERHVCVCTYVCVSVYVCVTNLPNVPLEDVDGFRLI